MSEQKKLRNKLIISYPYCIDQKKNDQLKTQFPWLEKELSLLILKASFFPIIKTKIQDKKNASSLLIFFVTPKDSENDAFYQFANHLPLNFHCLSIEHISFQINCFTKPLIGIRAECIKNDLQKHIENHELKKIKTELIKCLNKKRYISCKETLSNHKKEIILKKISQLIQKFNRFLDLSMIDEVERLFVLTDNSYEKFRKTDHLIRLSLSLYLIQKAFLGKMTSKFQSQHIYLRILPTVLHFPFHSKSVLTIVMGIYLSDSYQKLEKDQIIAAIQAFIPDVFYIKHSFYYYNHPNDPIKRYIIDCAKISSKPFSSEEILLLKKKLGEKIQSKIVTLTPSLFWIHNEEEMMKNILTLAREVTHHHDLPQVIVSFERQRTSKLCFRAIVLRLLLQKIDPLKNFEKNLFYPTQLFLEKSQIVGYFKENYIKQADVIRFEIPIEQHFLRNDSSINLYYARARVIAFLTNILGPIRDYNGGLILKQSELLLEMKKYFAQDYETNPELIENFFYGLTPIEKQSTLPFEILKEGYQLIIELLNKSSNHNKEVLFSFHFKDHWIFFALKALDEKIHENIIKTLEKAHIPPSEYISTKFHEKDFFYSTFLASFYNQREKVQFIKTIRSYLAHFQKSKNKQKILRISSNDLPQSLDPRMSSNELSGTLTQMLFEGLMRIGKDRVLNFGVAENVIISSQHTQYIFQLRKCYWSNEQPVCAYDFEYAWKKSLSPRFKTSFSYFFYPIKNAKECKENQLSLDQLGVKSLNERTLVVHLNHPTPYFLELTAHSLLAPVNHKIDQRSPSWSLQEGNFFVCNGPFKLKEKKASYMTMDKNQSYWNSSQVKLETIHIFRSPSSLALNMFMQKKIDWLGPPFHPWDSSLYLRKNLNNSFDGASGVYWYVCNIQDPFLQHIKFRQALSYAIDREQLIKALNENKPMISPLPYKHAKHNDLQMIKGDEKKASQLLKEFLAEQKLDLKDLSPLTLSISLGNTKQKIATIISKRWEQILGIRCRIIEVSNWQTFFKSLKEKRFQIAGIMWAPWIDDPSYTLDVFKEASHPVNFSKWTSSDFIKWIHKAATESKEKERLQHLANAEKILIQQSPIIPLFSEESGYLASPSLKKFCFTGIGRIDFTHAYFA